MVRFVNSKYFYSGLFLLVIPFLCIAEIYKTVDENGQVVFTDKPSVSAEQIEVDTSLIGTVESGHKSKQLVMYSTSWCGVCKVARKYMQSKGIRYMEYDIEKMPSRQQEFKRLGGSGVPLILVGTQKMKGFSATRLEAMLSQAQENAQEIHK